MWRQNISVYAGNQTRDHRVHRAPLYPYGANTTAQLPYITFHSKSLHSARRLQRILFLVFRTNLLILASLSTISAPLLVLITDLSSCDVMPGWWLSLGPPYVIENKEDTSVKIPVGLGRSCGALVLYPARDQEVKASNPDGGWAFFIFYLIFSNFTL